MYQSLRSLINVGIVHFMAYPQTMKGEGPVLETLQEILFDPYFGAIEVTRVADPAVACEAAALLRASHAKVGFGAQPVLLGGGLNLNALDSGERRKAVDAVRACFDQAVQFGATAVAVLSGRWEKATSVEAEEALIASLVELSHEAAGHGLGLTLEIFDDELDKASYVGKWPVALRVGDRIRSECRNFGLMHDLSHLPILGETAAEALPPLKDLLVHMHMGNAVVTNRSHPAYGDHHPRFGIEDGANDVGELADFLTVLYQIGYLSPGERKVVAFEVKPMAAEDSRIVIANAKRALDAAIAIADHRLFCH